MRQSPSRSRRAAPLLVPLASLAILLLAAGSFYGTRMLVTRSARTPDTPPAPDTAQVTQPPVLPAVPPPPGAGILTGRLVDALTGLPVTDAGVTLQEQGRRGLSGPDGRFRFDGVPAGSVTVALGPVDGYVPRSLEAHQSEEGLDLGITPLVPIAPPVYLVPEFGGLVPGCRDTRLVFASTILAEPATVSVTCVERASDFPAPPPAGRLPLAVVDAAPATLTPLSAPQLVVELPPQPRYGSGVKLDLLRLDLDRLAWRPAGQLVVDPGGRTASGPVASLGTFLVLAPPFGEFATGTGEGAALNRFSIGGRPDGEPEDVFGPDTPIVYASFDYARMENTPILARTVDTKGTIVFESRRPYTGDGRDNVPMVAPDGRRWPPGAYVTSVYVGESPASAGSGIAWQVVAQPTPEPAPPTVPPPPPILAGPLVPLPAPGAISGCMPPLGWWARIVAAGDTLSGLAARSGTSVGALMQANCLTNTALFAGQVLFLPRPPASLKPPALLPPAKPPVYPTWAIRPTMPAGTDQPPIYPSPLPGFPEATPWKPTPPPGGWTPVAPPAYPTEPPAPPEPQPTYPVYPTSPPAARGAATPIVKWTPAPGPEPTLAPRPTTP